MIGVVVWSDSAKKKAVIWGEDQRDLAYCLLPETATEPMRFGKGDLVEFETRYENRMRIAENVQIVETDSRSGLADALRHSKAADRREEASSQRDENDSSFRGAEVTTLPVATRNGGRGSVHEGADPEGCEMCDLAQHDAARSREANPERRVSQAASGQGATGQGALHADGAAPERRTVSATILPFPELMRA